MIATLAAQHGWVVTELTPLQVSLEDAYLKLTQGDVEYAGKNRSDAGTKVQ